MTAAESICSLCQHPLVSADSDDGSAPQGLQSLMCGCTFHAECITAFCDQAHTTVLEMRCPVCRQTADAVATLEATATQNLDPGAAVAEPLPAAAIETPGAAVAELEAELAVVAPAAADVAPAGNDNLFGEEVAAEAADPEDVARDDVNAAPDSRAVGADATATEVETEEGRVVVIKRPAAVDGVYPEEPKFCSKCHNYAPKAKVRCINKTKQLFQCNVCGCRITQLTRQYGVWPTDDFKAISEEEKVAFMKACGEAKDQDQLKLVSEEYLRRFEKRARFFLHNGEFLPLSVWGTRGFDTERIASSTPAADTVEHPVLGKCYRVEILSTGSKGELGWERDSSANATGVSSRGVQPTLQIMPAPAQTVANAESDKPKKKEKSKADKADSDDSSSDSDDSSSSDDKATLAAKAKRAKAKEAKRLKKIAKKKKAAAAAEAKANKDKEKSDKKEQLQAAKDKKKKKTLAEQMIKKMQPVVAILQSSLAQPQTIQAPLPIVTRAQQELAMLEDHVKRAQLVKNNQNNALPCELASVVTMISRAKLANNVLASMIANMTRLEASMSRHGIAGA